MDKVLLTNVPYERFSESRWGLAPGIVVTLHATAYGKKISGVKALIDTGTEITCVYPKSVNFDPSSELEFDPRTGDYLLGVEVEGQIYYVTCAYWNHPYQGSEQVLLGMNMMENWLITLHGRNHLLSVTNLDEGEQGGTPEEIRARRVEVPTGGEDYELWKKATLYQLIYSLSGLSLGLLCIIGGIVLFIMGVGGNINWIVKAEGFNSQLVNAAPGVVLFLVGMLVAWMTRFNILASKAAKRIKRKKESVTKT